MRARLNLIGAGHVGRVLGKLFHEHGVFTVQDVLTRSAASADAAVAFIGAGRGVASLDALRPAEVILVAVGDDQIAGVAAALGARAAGATVFHCSGAKTAAELAALNGAHCASAHPIRSFADPARVAAEFAGTYVGIEGAPAALAVLTPALEAIGARPVPIDTAAKTVYHAAAVFASNYLVAVMDAALRAYAAAGIAPEVARALAAPLASETLANVLRLGPEAALSGPIARGDLATVARQQAAVSAWDAPSGALYAALAAATQDLAARRNRGQTPISPDGNKGA
ncbi:Rossmann-like and DUF2520 domain-containing protein [Massilia sp. TS11]|uniref:Rossmann-like and DUF2520 domain-containing protein n=1 Tax=Massilia sp. TS11 TaxID=2908003 RepID=UPI001EDA7649|nr:Rossmann-like and DUF2520 domain-containing protein [Massilia sp. TS11]MCG2585286.1 DUF2520 domain-containing protein [Massilia sp. TS11]